MTAVPSSAAAAQAVEAGTAAIVYPKTRSVDLVEDHFGIPVADPYRWLENDVRTDPEVKAWVDAENAVTNRFLADPAAARLVQAAHDRALRLRALRPAGEEGRRTISTPTTAAFRTRRCCSSATVSTVRRGR